jgi:chemotaxis protein methyltransferase CheR
MALAQHEFDYVRQLVQNRSAIVLEKGKEYLVESRLQPLARREGFASLESMVAHLRSQPLNGLHHKSGGGDDHERNVVLSRLASV